MIYIGLPQWSHPKWVRLGITSLEEYARHFNCVEGNTTLYALPKPEVVLRWREQTTVPVHAVLTATNPLIRFIGSDDMTQNRELFQVWLQKLAQWHQTTTPYLFLHTPDIAQAPELVHTLWEDLRKTLPEIGAVPAIPQQSSLF